MADPMTGPEGGADILSGGATPASEALGGGEESPSGDNGPAPITRPSAVIAVLAYIGEVSILLGQTLRQIVRGRIDARELIDQMAQLGVNSVAISLLTSFATGAVLALYFAPFLYRYGAQTFVGGVVALAFGRELGPVLTGVMVAARAGSAIAAEIGTMKVTEQVDALRSLAVSPIDYLVTPRVLAALTMMPIVCALSDAVGIAGGYVEAVYKDHIPAAMYLDSIRMMLAPSDFYWGMVKTVIFGLIIAVVGCHQGLRTEGGATEVGRATTNAVVISIVLIYVANYFLAFAMFSGTKL